MLASTYGYDSRAVGVGQAEPNGPRSAVEIPLTPLEDPDEDPKVELSGIGAMLGPERDVVVVGELVEGGGAAEAGLLPGDEILAIDGRGVSDMDFNMIIQQIRGPKDTSLVLKVRRDGETKDIAVYRRHIRAAMLRSRRLGEPRKA